MLPLTLTNRLHTLPDSGDAALRAAIRRLKMKTLLTLDVLKTMSIDELEGVVSENGK